MYIRYYFSIYSLSTHTLYALLVCYRRWSDGGRAVFHARLPARQPRSRWAYPRVPANGGGREGSKDDRAKSATNHNRNTAIVLCLHYLCRRYYCSSHLIIVARCSARKHRDGCHGHVRAKTGSARHKDKDETINSGKSQRQNQWRRIQRPARTRRIKASINTRLSFGSSAVVLASCMLAAMLSLSPLLSHLPPN